MLLKLKNVVKTYPEADGSEGRAVLNGVDLTIQAGDFVGITGASGAGKSTLLNIVSFLDRPTSGPTKPTAQPAP